MRGINNNNDPYESVVNIRSIPLVPSDRKSTKKQFMQMLDIERNIIIWLLSAWLSLLYNIICSRCVNWS